MADDPAPGRAGEIEAAADDLAAAYRRSFRRLLDAIRARVTQWISQETDPLQCARIAGFGAQLAALEAILRPIVEPMLPLAGRRWRGAFLRGVYLTSTQQDALSIDVLLPEMARRFGLPRTGTAPPDLGRADETLGYFVEGTFRRVILPEAGLALQDNARARSVALRGSLAATAGVLACLGLGLACALSYRDGVARIDGLNAAVAPLGETLFASEPAKLPAILSSLDLLADLREPGPAAFRPPVIPLDRYAQALIAEHGEATYDKALANSLAPHLAFRLARDLVRPDAPSEALGQALAAAAAKPADGKPADAAYDRWLAGGGSADLPPAMRTELTRHGAAALAIGAAPAVDPAYPAFARALLSDRGEAK